MPTINRIIKPRATIDLNKIENSVNVKDIVRIEGASNYSFVYTTKKRIIITKPLKYFELELCHDYFLRIHKSHLVNMNHVKKMGGSEEYKLLKTTDGKELEISRRKSGMVRRFFENK